MRRIPISILVLVVLGACVSVNKSVLNESFMAAPVPVNNVNVLLASAGDENPTSCTRIAILSASGSDSMTNQGEMIDKLREEAGKLGANLVFIQDIEEAGTGAKIANALFGFGANRKSESLAYHCEG